MALNIKKKNMKKRQDSKKLFKKNRSLKMMKDPSNSRNFNPLKMTKEILG